MLYSAVGHGGASGYLALMALFSFAPDELKSTALILNCFVSLIAFLSFVRKGHFNLKLFILVAISSVPFAFIGGMLTVDAAIYKKILGIVLLFATLKLIGVFDAKKKNEDELKLINPYLALLIGGAIGFLSGLIGIGGGIILTPVLLLLRWTTLKEAAGISALFIFVNSLSGLAGMLTKEMEIANSIYLLITLAVVGGLIGSYFGSSKLNNLYLKYILAFVLLVASIKLFFV